MRTHMKMSWVSALLLCVTASVAMADVYVDHEKGADDWDGTIATHGDGARGPVRRIARALQIRKPGDRIILAKCRTPYREEIHLVGEMVRPGSTLVIEGNGAVLEGISPERDWKDEGGGIISTGWAPDWGFFVVAEGRPPVRAKSLEAIQPGECYADYAKHIGYYKLRPGEAIGKTRLETPRGYCGVVIDQCSNVLIRNLTCQYFWNDGFNIQADSQDIRFENVVGRWNGDEGMSAHGTADVTVIGAEFYGNDNGLCDTVMSRTRYIGLNVHDNRSIGVWFQGGDHTIINARIVDNPAGVQIEEGQGPTYLPGFEQSPDVDCRLTMRNVLVSGGAFGVKLAHHSRMVLEHVTLTDQPVGVSLMGEGVDIHVINSIIDAGELSIEGAGAYWGDYNCWSNASAKVKTGAVKLPDWLVEHKTDGHSMVADPQMDPEGNLSAESPAIGKAYVDDGHLTDLMGSGMWDKANPLRVNRNLGADPATIPQALQR